MIVGCTEPKLKDEHRMIACRMSGEGVSYRDILTFLKNEYKISMTRNGIISMLESKRSQPFVKRFREDYLRKIKDVPIANKRIRIDDLERIRKKIISQLDSNELNTRERREEFRHLVRTLNDVIINAREEMERKPQLIAGLGLIGEFSDKSDDELIARKDELVKCAHNSLAGGSSGNRQHPEGTEDQDTAEPA